MGRGGRAILAGLAALALYAAPARAVDSPTPWDGVNPFVCELQFAGFGTAVPHPEADPYCVEFDKRRQNVSELGVVQFLSLEPARVAAASPKCFYFQSDHWRGSLVQGDPSTKTYEWDGHYFFDKASGEGGVWVTNFNFNGQTQDPGQVPGMPPEYGRYFGPGTGGFRTRNSVPADPQCAERAARERDRIYAGTGAAPSRCLTPAGGVSTRGVGPVRLGQTEAQVRRALGPPETVKRGFLRYCVQGGGSYEVGQSEDRSGDLGEGGDERTVMVLSTSKRFRHKRVGPGTSKRTFRRRLKHSRRLFRMGKTQVYLARTRSRVLFGVRGRRVTFVAVRDRKVAPDKGRVASFLRRAG
jgi:hypothetical protein